MELISKWLENRYYYVSIDGRNSYVGYYDVRTVQGLVLGPILYALFVSPLFDLPQMTLFADDNYIGRWNKHQSALIKDMERSLEMITKWLKESGLKVNESKMEICLFHRKDQPPIAVEFNGTLVVSKKAMNMLGVSFDSKLNWQNQIQKAITKSKKALHAIFLIRKHITKTELLQITTSNYYSILCCNAEIWLTPTLSNNSKRTLMAASAAPLKLFSPAYDHMMSYESLHTINNRATPAKVMNYKTSLILHKVYNDKSNLENYIDLFFNQNFNARAELVNFIDKSNYKVGKNIVTNRFTIVNNKIP